MCLGVNPGVCVCVFVSVQVCVCMLEIESFQRNLSDFHAAFTN